MFFVSVFLLLSLLETFAFGLATVVLHRKVRRKDSYFQYIVLLVVTLFVDLAWTTLIRAGNIQIATGNEILVGIFGSADLTESLASGPDMWSIGMSVTSAVVGVGFARWILGKSFLSLKV